MANANEKYDEAIALKEAGKLDEAVVKLEELLRDEPNHALAHAGLSKFYSDLERHDEAVEHQRKVCQLEPDDPFSFMAMSLICQKADRIAEAEQAMAEAMQKQWAARKEP